MANKAKADTVIANIMKGEYDTDLDAIRDTVRWRSKNAAQGLFYELNVGDEIIVKNCRPLYLNGCKGVVRKKLQKNVRIDLYERAGRFHHGITVPMSMLEKAA